MVWFRDARTPEGTRLYVIGDVHGCVEQLIRVHRAIDQDRRRRPAIDWRIVHLGDYVDRGPESRDVISFLRTRMLRDDRVLCIRGNHDQMFADAVAGDLHRLHAWLENGGVETLCSYRVDPDAFVKSLEKSEDMAHRFPETHLEFLNALPVALRFGDYFFVHAGVRPDLPFGEQSVDDLMWIREPFLTWPEEYEAIVVHGHTPVEQIDTRVNRIGIDTGACYGGRLTCLVLEGTAKGMLNGGRVEPLPPPAMPRTGWL